MENQENQIENVLDNKERAYATGKRKNSIARDWLKRGSGEIKINGKPLVYWSILASLRSKKINHTWVSSDSKKILDFSKKMGAKILKRSKKNSSDTASSEKAWLESVKQIELKYQKKIDIYSSNLFY